MAKARPYGTGSMLERSPGVFVLRVNAPPDPATGQRRRPTKTVHGTKKQAQAELDRMRDALDGAAAPAKVTVGRLVDDVLAVRDLAPATRQDWDRVIAHYIRPQLGALELRKLTTQRIDAHYAELRRAGVSQWRILKVHEVLSVVCQQAVEWGWLRASPLPKRRPAKPPRKSRAHPEAVIVALSIKAFTDRVWGLWFHLSVILGPRRGELAAITWADIDLDARTLRIDKAAVSITGRGTLIEPTKTRDWRTVDLDDETVEMLRARQLRHRETVLGRGMQWSDGLHVMTHRRQSIGSRPVRPDAATHWFARMRKTVAKTHPAASKVRLGDLRHLAGSEMLKAGIELQVVADILGNDPETLLANYAEVLEGRKRTAVEAMAALAKTRRAG